VAPRPYDWSPLGLGSDPVPGSPEAVSAESRRLGQTAQELRAQITMLQEIAGDTTLKGQYAGTMRAHAQQLSQDLGKVATRYESVADATGQWSGHLAQAQATSLAALRMAQGPYEQLLRLQAPTQPPASATATAQRQYAADRQYYQQAQSSAQASISDAQRLIGQATSNRDTAGATAAAKISSASHDSLADSWWDQFKQMISSIANNLKTVATVIGYIATACAILAVILTGPLGLVFLLLAGGLLLTELGVHTILAATGNGSWVDVGLDVFALATLGYGSILDAGAEAAEETASDAAVEAIQEERPLTSASESIAESANALKDAAAEFGDEEITASANRIAEIAGSIKTSASNLAKSESKEEIEGLLKDTAEEHNSFLDYAKDLGGNGSRGTGKALDSVTALAKRLPDNPQIAQALKTLKPLATKNAMTFLSGTSVDASDKILSLASPSYDDLKDKATYALPADIGTPVTAGAEMWTPTDFVVHMTQLASR
jgi:hypothetical protein